MQWSEMLTTFFRESGLMPHGYCLVWNPLLLYSHLFSDLFVFIAYMIIPAAMFYFIRARKDIPKSATYILFYSFILLCGLTHILGVVVLYKPIYGVQAVAKILTALVSMITAVMVWRLMPVLLSIPTPSQLSAKNEELKKTSDELFLLNKTLEEKVEQQTEYLTEANEELQNFSYIVTHDLKEPLRGMSQFGQLLKQRESDRLSAQGQEFLDHIIDSSKKMTELLKALSEYTQSERVELNYEQTDIGTLATEVAAMLKHAFEEQNVELIIDDEMPQIAIDKVYIGQVLYNLINNAIKYNDSSQKKIHVGFTHLDGKLTFFVKDNGIGIAADKEDMAFEVFRRLHAADIYGEGTGMGLSISRQLTKRHGGKIWLKSAPGEGTTVYFTVNETS